MIMLHTAFRFLRYNQFNTIDYAALAGIMYYSINGEVWQWLTVIACSFTINVALNAAGYKRDD